MTDQQPENPAAPAPEIASADATEVASEQTRDQEPPARWSGSAAVPAHVPRRAWWSRRRPAAPASPATRLGDQNWRVTGPGGRRGT